MLSNNRLISRALITTVATASLALGALFGTAPASAHVRVDADAAVSGESAILTFRVPSESDAGSPTTGLSVALPNLASVSTSFPSAQTYAGAALLAAVGTAAALVRRRA